MTTERGLVLSAAVCALLATCDDSGTYVDVTVTGRVTGLWQGARVVVVVNGSDGDSRTRIYGSDDEAGDAAADDAVTFAIGLSGRKGDWYSVVVDEASTGFRCTVTGGGDGVLGEASSPAEIECSGPLERLIVSAAPTWMFDPTARMQAVQLPADATVTTLDVSGSFITRVTVDGADVPTHQWSRERYLGLGANQSTVEVHAGYAKRTFELTMERPGLVAPAVRHVATIPRPYSGFGSRFAADGDLVAVGSGHELEIFRIAPDDTWTLEASLPHDSGERGLALDGDRLALGNERTGKVELFERTEAGWERRQVLSGPAPSSGSGYGSTLAFFDDTLVVGAPQDRVPAVPPQQGEVDGGAVYVYRRGDQGWALETRLTAPNPSTYDNFGAQVAISFNVIAVAAPFEDSSSEGILARASNDDSWENSGAVYTFMRLGTWRLQNYIKAERSLPGMRFGRSIAFVDDRLVVAAPFDHDEETFAISGALHVLRSPDPFAAIAWQVEDRLKSQIPGAAFGSALALRDGLIIAASDAEDTEVAGAGAVQIFGLAGGQWTPRGLLKTPRPAYREGLGSALAITASALLVSAPGHDQPVTTDVQYESDAGAVYAFGLAP